MIDLLGGNICIPKTDLSKIDKKNKMLSLSILLLVELLFL